MPLYKNPDFCRLPPSPAAIFSRQAQDSFFALPAWYDLMARHGVPAGTQIRLYTHERPGCEVALVLHTDSAQRERRLSSLVNFYGVEHGIVSRPGADLSSGLSAVLTEILAERPRLDYLFFSEFNPREPGYADLVEVLRQARLFVECLFHSGTWYEETAGLNFADYLAARPALLRNTWRRKQRKIAASARLDKVFYNGIAGIDQAIADYETIYAASWKTPEMFPRFIPALIRLAAELGALRLGLFYIDGIPAAAQFWIVWRNRAVIYKLAHDRRFDHLSLGTILTMDMVNKVLSEDQPAEINFGHGDDPYKKLWLPRRRERWGITAANPWTIAGMRLGLAREAAKLFHRLRGKPLMPVP